MADKGMTLAVVLLVAGLIVGGGIGYFAAPQGGGGTSTITATTTSTVTNTAPGTVEKVLPLKGQTIKLGLIAASTTGLETNKPYAEQIIGPLMDEYSALLGYGTKFQWLVDDAQEAPNIHLEKVQGYKSAGITVFIGGLWSGQAAGSLNYVNTNKMLMWSSDSTSPTLAIANDRLYRMCTADSALAPALADVMWAAGVKELVIFQRGDTWGDGIVNLLVPIWEKMGGKIAGEKVRYAIESKEFAAYLDLANQQVKTAVSRYSGPTAKYRVGVVILSFDEFPVICKQAKQYPDIYGVHWWGSDGTAVSQRGMDDAPDEVNAIGIYSLLSRETKTPLFDDLKVKYEAITKQAFTAYTSYRYDIATILERTMFQAQSNEADAIIKLQTPAANSLFGAAGWSKLDEFGDRAAPPYDVWGFYPGSKATPPVTKPSISLIMAQYDPVFRQTTFINSILGFSFPGP